MRVSRDNALNDYKRISDYGLIGDQKTCALVGIDGSIDWLCIPRFDSASIFAAILDREKGGRFRIMPRSEHFLSYQHYEGLTNILVTEFETNTGRVALTDFMPCFKVNKTVISCGEIHRRLECLEGNMRLEIFLQPKFEYGRVVPRIKRIDEIGYTIFSDEQKTRQEVALMTPMELDDSLKGLLTGTARLKRGDSLCLVLRYGGARMHHQGNTFSEVKLRETRDYWRKWVSNCSYVGKWKEEVRRSALALKLLVYSPTGAIVAAPTTSLPEELRGVRNWDYRYSWLRDSTFVLWAFHSLGFAEEALSYLEWILGIFSLTGGNLQVMLGISGERDLSEYKLSHLQGYKGSSPVRVGNGAWDQFQLDVYGVLLDAMYFSHKHGGGVDPKVYNYLIKEIMRALEADWTQPDSGIWEVRGEQLHFVYSKMWCWVAADRATKIAESLSFKEDANRWSALRDRIRSQIMDKGWSDSINAFVRSYSSLDLDSANLLMSQVGFINAKDPKMISTVDAIMKKLLNNGLFLRRYIAGDGLPGKEGAFLICSFWLIQCLAEGGRVDEAEKMMDAIVKFANHLGLFSEEIDPASGLMLGNFPQAFTHMGFITAATALNKALFDKRQ